VLNGHAARHRPREHRPEQSTRVRAWVAASRRLRGAQVDAPLRIGGQRGFRAHQARLGPLPQQTSGQTHLST
jgi:hypothetical protein